MTDQSQVLDLAVIFIDLVHQPVGIARGCKVFGGNKFFFWQFKLLCQDFRCLLRSQVRAGHDQVYFYFQLL